MPPKRMTANPVRAPRYRPGKPVAPDSVSSSEEESESESEAEAHAPPPKPVYIKKKPAAAPALKDVDLSKRFQEGAAAEAARIEEEKKKAEAEKGSADEYTTEESSGEEESEEEEEEEEEEAPRKVLLRPTFVPKAKRGAAATTEVDEKTAEEERRKKEAAELLEAHLKRDAEARAAGRRGFHDEGEEGEGIDDTDNLDPAAERAAWKLRELTRIKREREALAAIEKERAEIERRREMDPALREKEDLEFVREQRKEKMESRGKMGFMQKFYHKGAFYQDADILKRNYATAEVEDRAKNREVLPKYMQVRGDEVGKRGRTKWTHLAAEDTTLMGDNPRVKKKGFGEAGFGGAGTGGNRVPIASGVDERFKPDDRGRREGGPGGRQGADRNRRDDRDFDCGDLTPRDDGDRRRDDGPRRSRWDDDSGRRPPDGPRGDRGRGGDSYFPGRDDDRERKRPHSPRDRAQDAEKRRRRHASPVK
ncbi:micro-fibrillar-associated protein 1 [Sphaerosporella brunnea]|uniref:Micro-fibrillar-associated protein 1 n=1 Tax=Sphaerosporella brunnea TaxID=1250544 RepID=A0A5J5F3J0_9PEZI|nr:micro-fibrillar-associated protein 1 [Sphaerosporella brunnea]